MTRSTASPWAMRRQEWGLGIVLLVLAGSGCDGLLKNDQLPPDVSDPAVTRTPQGALAAYYGAISDLRDVYGLAGTGGSNLQLGTSQSFVAITGLLSDELMSVATGGSGTPEAEDARILPELAVSSTLQPSYEKPYAVLQRVRGQARQAIGLLAEIGRAHV